MPEQPEVFLSGDGSHTLISNVFQSSYHSKHGAITESNVVFIQAGLDFLLANKYEKIRVFEMGFGTGLNALLTCQWATQHNVQLYYHTVEAFPINIDIVKELNYGKLCQNELGFQKLHQTSWDQIHVISENFMLQKYLSKIEDIEITEKFDIIFYDAFGPTTQAELWSEHILHKMYHLLDDNGILVSFCAQGAFKRNLKAVGFVVESLSGPPGKREMTRAIKK
jgi:tRNA U34 5-methylaminomethyl-2-thiouridine-forming methyltransferase MnmC